MESFPLNAAAYRLDGKIGQGSSGVVWSATCLTNNKQVAIKVIDLENAFNIDDFTKEITIMRQCNHPNVVACYGSFVNDKSLWILMELMRIGSCLDIMKFQFNDGFDEPTIAWILREVLQGLEYLHSNRQIHRDIKAGNILVDLERGVQLADFGVSALLMDRGRKKATTFVGTPCWMAPEVMEQVNGYDEKADVWSFGITALELANGRAPFSKYPPMKVLLLTLRSPPPRLHDKFSKLFRDMVSHCLQKDPSKRPTCSKLLEHKFFKGLPSNASLSTLCPSLESMPPLGQRYEAMQSQQVSALERLLEAKGPGLDGLLGADDNLGDGVGDEDEEGKGHSGWDFDVEGLRAEAKEEDANGAAKRSRFQVTTPANAAVSPPLNVRHVSVAAQPPVVHQGAQEPQKSQVQPQASQPQAQPSQPPQAQQPQPPPQAQPQQAQGNKGEAQGRRGSSSNPPVPHREASDGELGVASEAKRSRFKVVGVDMPKKGESSGSVGSARSSGKAANGPGAGEHAAAAGGGAQGDGELRDQVQHLQSQLQHVMFALESLQRENAELKKKIAPAADSAQYHSAVDGADNRAVHPGQ